MRIKINQIILHLLTFILVISCEKASIIPKDHPIVLMKEVNVSESGTEFVADVISLGKQNIIAHGFVWAHEADPDSNSAMISDSSNLNLGTFSAIVQSGFIDENVYFVRPFISTDQGLILGSSTAFSAVGGPPIEVVDFDPKAGTTGEVVTIYGNHFGNNINFLTVTFANIESRIISLNDSIITVNVPKLKFPQAAELKVSNGSDEAIATSTFQYN